VRGKMTAIFRFYGRLDGILKYRIHLFRKPHRNENLLSIRPNPCKSFRMLNTCKC
jgi:hypothetical protein